MDEFDTRIILNIDNGAIQVESTTSNPESGNDICQNFEGQSCGDGRDIHLKHLCSASFSCYSCVKTLNAIEISNDHWVHDSNEDEGRTKEETEEIKSKTEVQCKPKIWKCKYNCGKIFTQEKYMNNHILVMHENINMVQCKKCLKYLSTESRLKSHMLRHSTVKHLICLLCRRKRSNELSCIRYHLLEKHGITSKHFLFNQCYYQLSLKEISIMEKLKKKSSESIIPKKRKESLSTNQKSAVDIKTLKTKIMELSGKVQSQMETSKILEAEKRLEENNCAQEESTKPSLTSSTTNSIHISTVPQKIVTAENGMKLLKLPNGQFKKMTDF